MLLGPLQVSAQMQPSQTDSFHRPHPKVATCQAEEHCLEKSEKEIRE